MVQAERLARAGYDAYGEQRGWAVASGASMPTWEAQGEAFREGWRAAARGVVAEYERQARGEVR